MGGHWTNGIRCDCDCSHSGLIQHCPLEGLRYGRRANPRWPIFIIMAQAPTTHVVILNAIVDRLISQIDEFNRSTCVISIDPMPAVNIDHNLFCTVSPNDGSFLEDVFVGAGENSLIEQTATVVTLWSAIRLGRRGVDKELLTNRSRGLLTKKRDILKALTGYMLTDGEDDILTNYLQPISAMRPMPPEPEERLGDMQLVFKTEFEWDLAD